MNVLRRIFPGRGSAPVELADVYGGVSVRDAMLDDDVVATARGHDDLDHTWDDVCTFIDACPEHAHLDPERQAVALIYFSCVGTDRFPVEALIDPRKLPNVSVQEDAP